MEYSVDPEKARKKAEKEQKKQYDILIQKYRQVFSSDDGLAVLDDLLTMCAIYHSPIGTDTHDTYRLIGIKEIGLRILQKIQQADPNIYIKLLQRYNKTKKGEK